MDIQRIHAFAVEPVRTTGVPSNPVGGAVRVTEKLRSALDRNIGSALFDRRTLIDFEVDPATRTNQIRDAVMEYAFGDSRQAGGAALTLANQLSQAMDLRSEPALFVAAALANGTARAVVLWIFPRDAAFRFHRAGTGAAIDILTDIFSQSSKLRKAARFEGRNLRGEFYSGRALDFQLNRKSKPVADFWVVRFLQCALSLRADAGTRLVAQAIRNAIDTCESQADQEALFTAVMALRRSRRGRWSPRDIADQFLDGEAKTAFLQSIPNPSETLDATFQFQPDTFEAVLRFRVFQLDTGVIVYSPLEEVGGSVRIEDGEGRRLSCQGRIVGEKVRTRHA